MSDDLLGRYIQFALTAQAILLCVWIKDYAVMEGPDLFLVRGWIFLTPGNAWTVPRAHVIFQPVTVGHFPRDNVADA